jgi:hypothetical protein
MLFRDEDFIAAVSNALSPGGVLVAQIGKAGRMNDAPSEFARWSVVDVGLASDLQNHRFVKARQYSEGHGGLMGPWTFMVAFKDERTSERWFATEAEVELATRERLLPLPLSYFDGSIMRSYSFPSRVAEENFCRTDPSPSLCRAGHGFDPERPSAPASSLVIAQGSVNEAVSTTVALNESLPENTYFAIEEAVNDVSVLPRARRLIQSSATGVQGSALWNALAAFIRGNGEPSFFVSSGIAEATRTVCNNRTGGEERQRAPTMSETTAPVDDLLLHLSASLDRSVYDPFVDRNHMVLLTTALTPRWVHSHMGDRRAAASFARPSRAAHGNASGISLCPGQ